MIIGAFLFCILFFAGGLSFLSLALRILFVLVLPGFSVLQAAASDEFDFVETLFLSPVIGIALMSLIALYLSLLNITINAATVIIAVLLLSIPLLLHSWKRGKIRKTSFKTSLTPTTISIIMLLVSVSVLIIVLPIPRNGVLIPNGDDPATSTLAATLIVQQGKIPQSWAPYFPEESSFTYSPGYPSILAFLYFLDTTNPMPALANLFAVLFALLPCQIFILARKLTGDLRIALFSAATLALLSDAFYLMTSYGRFPALVGVALTLNLLIFSYLYSLNGKNKLLMLSGITLAALVLAYTTSVITAILFVILFFSFGLIFLKNKKRHLLGGASIIILSVILAFPWIYNIVNRLAIEVPAREYEALVAWYNMYSLQSNLSSTNIVMYYGYWLFLLGIIVLLITMVRKRASSFLLAWLLSICLLMSNEIFQFHFPSWYYLQSWTFLNPLLTFPFSILAGIGVIKVYDFLRERLRILSNKIMIKNQKVPIIAIPVLVALLCVTLTIFWNPLINNNMSDLVANRITTADYNAIQWILNNTPEDSVIFNDHWVGTPSIWIPTITHRRIVMPLLSISEAGWTDIMFTRQDESVIIARDPNSTEALSILKKYEASYIYLSNNCSVQVEKWRNNYNSSLFLKSPHYELAFNEENAWVIRVIY